MAANRLSYTFGFHGPSMVIDTACSSSIAALHVACQSLRNGECTRAIVASADLLLSQHSIILRQKAGMLSENGRCAVFDETANGYARGEGAACILLRLDNALSNQERENTYAFVRATSTNHNGQSARLTAPSGSAQQRLIEAALRECGISPDDVSFVEAHGTGTALGDPIEFNALQNVFCSPQACPRPLYVGASKSNIGHLEGTAGLAGFIKTCLILRNCKVPPNIHFKKLNPHMSSIVSPRTLSFPLELVDLPQPASTNGISYACVSSFGFGGSNSHVVLSSNPVEAKRSYDASDCSTPVKPFQICFACTGQGSQYIHMARELYEKEPVFREVLVAISDTLAHAFPQYKQPTLLDVMYPNHEMCDRSEKCLLMTQYAQPAIFAIGCALSKLWEHHGIRPDVVLGHSVGEFAACVIAGILDFKDATVIVGKRALLMQAQPPNGVMFAVKASLSEVEAVLQANSNFLGLVACACHNGPQSVVLSGPEDAVNSAVSLIGKSSRRLAVSHAFHSPQMNEAAKLFEEFLQPFHFSPPSIHFIANSTGQVASPSEINAKYLSNHMLMPVLFEESLKSLDVSRVSTFLFVELGPKPTLIGMARACFALSTPENVPVYIPSIDPNNPSDVHFNSTLHSIQNGFRRIYKPRSLPWKVSNSSSSMAFDEMSIFDETLTSDNIYTMVLECLHEVLPSMSMIISSNSNVLSLGLDSLSSVEFRNALSKRLPKEVQISLSQLFSQPIVSEIVSNLGMMLQNARKDATSVDSSIVTNDGAVFPSSSIQKGMIFNHLAYPSMRIFLLSFLFRLEGTFNLHAYRMAWMRIIDQYPAFRTGFILDGAQETQLYISNQAKAQHQKFDDVPLQVVDISGKKLHEQDIEIRSRMSKERELGINVTKAGLFRLHVFVQSSQVHTLMITIHHLIMDGRSLALILGSLMDEYYRVQQEEPPLPIREESNFSNFIWIERAALKSESAQYFNTMLKGVNATPSVLLGLSELSFDLPDEGLIYNKSFISDVVLDRLKKVALQNGITMASICHAAWALVYSVYLRNFDVIYGATTSGRSVNVKNIDKIVGPVVNTCPVRFSVRSSDNILSHLQQVQLMLLSNLDHENFPLAQIQNNCGLRPIFSVIVDFQSSSWGLNFRNKDGSASRSDPPELIDRIACPLTIRFLLDSNFIVGSVSVQERLRCTINSESSHLDASFVETTMKNLETVLAAFASIQDLQSTSLLSIQRLVQVPASAVSNNIMVPLSLPLPVGPRSLTIEHSCTLRPIQSQALLRNSKLWQVQPEVVFFSIFALVLEKMSTEKRISIHADLNAHETPLVTIYTSGATPFAKFVSSIHAVLQNCQINCQSHSVDSQSDTGQPIETSLGSRSNSMDLMLTSESSGAKDNDLTIRTTLSNQIQPVEYSEGVVFSNCMDEPYMCFAPPHSMAFRSDIQCVIFNSFAFDINNPEDLKWVLHFAENRFPLGFPERFIELYEATVQSLCSLQSQDALISDVLAAAHTAAPVDPPRPLPQQLLHEPFLLQASESPAAPAVVDARGSVCEVTSFFELQCKARAVAVVISSLLPSTRPGVVPVVAVLSSKWSGQVACVLGILQAGCAYLPMDPKQLPRHRAEQVLSLSGAVAVLTTNDVLKANDWLASLSIPVIDAASLAPICHDVEVYCLGRVCTELGYLIYTSGSTGVPKGVSCHHQGALNTIFDLNERFGVGPSDRVLALSSLSFDLSVYDIFGLLAAGGCIVVPPAESLSPPDPKVWLDLVHQQSITLWNSVPAFMELIVCVAENSNLRLPSSLRLIFLSGDWIPLSLPARIRAISDCANLRIISMGGATEAAIWSNMYEIPVELDSSWASIPYGRPLRNQTMYVLDEHFEHCEPWVTGVIFIGGGGVAHGYHGDTKRTFAQFVTRPQTGERLFRTGDLGRIRPDGLIEMLGREDFQVKINGFRVELGEIEQLIFEYPGVKACVCVVCSLQICAYVVLNENGLFDGSSNLRDYLSARLPSYMVPRHILSIDEIPLTSVGKLDRRRLPDPDFNESGIADSIIPPANELQRIVHAAFASVLGVEADTICCTNSSFFSIGGHSLAALRLLFSLKKSLNVDIALSALFRNPSVSGLSTHISSISKDCQSQLDLTMNLVEMRACSDPQSILVFIHPAGASYLCYLPLLKHIPENVSVMALDDGFFDGNVKNTFQSINQVANLCLASVQKLLSKHLPVHLAGWSYGGVVAFEIVQELHKLGLSPSSLMLVGKHIDSLVNLTHLSECLMHHLDSTFVPPMLLCSIGSVIFILSANCTLSLVFIHFLKKMQAAPELAENTALLERAELHYQECNRMLDT
jgi:amino acid adenylation domain-containing protein